MTTRYKVSLIFLMMGLIFTIPIASYAVPAAGIIEEISQPDGSPFKAQLQGDEFINWVQTPDGYTIARGRDGYWFYVSGYDADNNPILTDVPAHQPPPANLSTRIMPSLEKSEVNPSIENASYDLETGVLHFPAVEIHNAGGDIEVLAVDFTLTANDSSESVFELTHRQKSAYPAGQEGNAIYDAVTQVVSAPIVEVPWEGKMLFYTGKMKLLPSSLQFVVTQVEKLDFVDNQRKRGVRSLRDGHTEGEFPVLFILVEFNDQPHTYSVEQLQPLMDKLRDYHDKASYGKAKLVPVKETYGTKNDGFVGWVQLNRNHPNMAGNLSEENAQLSGEAVKAAAAYVDFSSYDTDGNKEIDSTEMAVVVLVAGYEAALQPLPLGAKSVWAHQGGCQGYTWNGYGWSMYYYCHVDATNVDVSSYVQVGEIQSDHPLTVGVIAHELGHLIFKLPDLYDVDSSSEGVGSFCLMAGGSWGVKFGDSYSGETPVLPSAWVKYHLGWVDAQTPSCNTAITAAGSDSATSTNTVFKVDSGNSGEYFLIENKQPLSYDRGFEWLLYPASNFGGLAIWHIDENQRKTDNTDNADDNHRLVDLEEADSLEWGRGDATDLWYAPPYIQFGSGTTPDSLRYDFSPSGLEITNISNSGEIMTANFGSSCTASGYEVYGVNDNGLNNSQFFTIDPMTLAVTSLGPVHEKRNLEALDMNSSGELYAVSSVSDSGSDDTIDPGYLYRVDTDTGEITQIAYIGYEDVDSISFDSYNQLWGWSRSVGAMTIDTTTGAVTLYESPYLEKVEDMSWNGSAFYVVNGNELWSYYGYTQFVCYLPGAKPEGIEFFSGNEMLLGIHGWSSIYVIDITDGCAIIGEITTPFNDIEGIAF
jgi:M6 family metalloprotease-like protein